MEDKMTADEVSARVKREIGENWQISNDHGVDLRRCLVTPEKRCYKDSLAEGQTIELWLVLEAHPDRHNGYQIVYDESRDEFGLAIGHDKSQDVFLAFYGDFLTTLEGM